MKLRLPALLLLTLFLGGCYVQINDRTFGIPPPGGNDNTIGTMHPSGAGTVAIAEDLLAGVEEIGRQLAAHNQALFTDFSMSGQSIINEPGKRDQRVIRRFLDEQLDIVIDYSETALELGYSGARDDIGKSELTYLAEKDLVARIERDRQALLVSHGLVARLYESAAITAFEVHSQNPDGFGLSTQLTAKEMYKMYLDAVRFVLAHELAHLWFHDLPGSVKAARDNELNADLFAAHVVFADRLRIPTLVPWAIDGDPTVLFDLVYGNSAHKTRRFHPTLEERKASYQAIKASLDDEISEGELWSLIFGRNLSTGFGT